MKIEGREEEALARRIIARHLVVLQCVPCCYVSCYWEELFLTQLML